MKTMMKAAKAAKSWTSVSRFTLTALAVAMTGAALAAPPQPLPDALKYEEVPKFMQSSGDWNLPPDACQVDSIAEYTKDSTRSVSGGNACSADGSGFFNFACDNTSGDANAARAAVQAGNDKLVNDELCKQLASDEADPARRFCLEQSDNYSKESARTKSKTDFGSYLDSAVTAASKKDSTTNPVLGGLADKYCDKRQAYDGAACRNRQPDKSTITSEAQKAVNDALTYNDDRLAKAQKAFDAMKAAMAASLEAQKSAIFAQIAKGKTNLETDQAMVQEAFARMKKAVNSVTFNPKMGADLCVKGQHNTMFIRGADGNNTVAVCPATLMDDPAELAGSLATALSHSIDSCSLDSMKMGTPAPPTVPMSGLLEPLRMCLAKRIDPDGKKTMPELPAVYPATATGSFDDAFSKNTFQTQGKAAPHCPMPLKSGEVGKQVLLNKSNGIDDGNDSIKDPRDQSNDAVAQFFADKALARYIASPGKTAAGAKADLRAALRPYCNAIYHPNGAHPDPQKLLNSIVGSDPDLRAVLGCPDSKSKGGDDAAKTFDGTDASAAVGPAPTPAPKTLQACDGAMLGGFKNLQALYNNTPPAPVFTTDDAYITKTNNLLGAQPAAPPAVPPTGPKGPGAGGDGNDDDEKDDVPAPVPAAPAVKPVASKTPVVITSLYDVPAPGPSDKGVQAYNGALLSATTEAKQNCKSQMDSSYTAGLSPDAAYQKLCPNDEKSKATSFDMPPIARSGAYKFQFSCVYDCTAPGPDRLKLNLKSQDPSGDSIVSLDTKTGRTQARLADWQSYKALHGSEVDAECNGVVRPDQGPYRNDPIRSAPALNAAYSTFGQECAKNSLGTFADPLTRFTRDNGALSGAPLPFQCQVSCNCSNVNKLMEKAAAQPGKPIGSLMDSSKDYCNSYPRLGQVDDDLRGDPRAKSLSVPGDMVPATHDQVVQYLPAANQACSDAINQQGISAAVKCRDGDSTAEWGASFKPEGASDAYLGCKATCSAACYKDPKSKNCQLEKPQVVIPDAKPAKPAGADAGPGASDAASAAAAKKKVEVPTLDLGASSSTAAKGGATEDPAGLPPGSTKLGAKPLDSALPEPGKPFNEDSDEYKGKYSVDTTAKFGALSPSAKKQALDFCEEKRINNKLYYGPMADRMAVDAQKWCHPDGGADKKSTDYVPAALMRSPGYTMYDGGNAYRLQCTVKCTCSDIIGGQVVKAGDKPLPGNLGGCHMDTTPDTGLHVEKIVSATSKSFDSQASCDSACAYTEAGPVASPKPGVLKEGACTCDGAAAPLSLADQEKRAAAASKDASYVHSECQSRCTALKATAAFSSDDFSGACSCKPDPFTTIPMKKSMSDDAYKAAVDAASAKSHAPILKQAFTGPNAASSCSSSCAAMGKSPKATFTDSICSCSVDGAPAKPITPSRADFKDDPACEKSCKANFPGRTPYWKWTPDLGCSCGAVPLSAELIRKTPAAQPKIAGTKEAVFDKEPDCAKTCSKLEGFGDPAFTGKYTYNGKSCSCWGHQVSSNLTPVQFANLACMDSHDPGIKDDPGQEDIDIMCSTEKPSHKHPDGCNYSCKCTKVKDKNVASCALQK